MSNFLQASLQMDTKCQTSIHVGIHHFVECSGIFFFSIILLIPILKMMRSIELHNHQQNHAILYAFSERDADALTAWANGMPAAPAHATDAASVNSVPFVCVLWISKRCLRSLASASVKGLILTSWDIVIFPLSSHARAVVGLPMLDGSVDKALNATS